MQQARTVAELPDDVAAIHRESRVWVTTRRGPSILQVPREGTLTTDGVTVRFVSDEKGELFAFDLSSTRVKFARLDGKIKLKTGGKRFRVWFRHPLNKGHIVTAASWRASRKWKKLLQTPTR
jgi:hypothetical protein